jgi:hypothetical protein
VGGSTVGTLIGNAIAPGVLDRYLGKTGFSSQQTKEPRDEDRPVNLWNAADEERDYGTHGAFDDIAKSRSYQLHASQHHGLLGAAAAAGVAGLTTALARRR